ncbi:alpha/beta hydrolase [Rhodotorula paludigena]|uniref:alpha/beta hydrolase n=1 Tax=Rhodotorula paludigena TaxID=86838 RepID=UPI00316C8715
MSPDTLELDEAPVSLAARSIAALQTAWSLSRFVPTALRTTTSYYLYGPPQESWPISLALFTAIAQYHASSQAAKRELRAQKGETARPIDAAKVMQATRRLMDRYIGRDVQPSGGAVVETEFAVRERGLGGLLQAADAAEDGQRRVKAEWLVHRSLLREGSPPTDKVLLYAHGGAYSVCSPKTHRTLLCQLSKQLKCRVFSLDYRLSPETKFPGALHDALAAYFYLNKDLGIPAGNILVGGDSAGGNLAMALILYIRDLKLPPMGGAVLLSPWVDMTASLGSWDENKGFDYIMLEDDTANPDPLRPPRLLLPPEPAYSELIVHPYVSPALTASLNGLPPFLIQSGGVEALRDEHTLLAQRASRAGVKVTHQIFRDGVHVFQAFGAGMGSAAEALAAAGEWARDQPEKVEPVDPSLWSEIDRGLRAAWDGRGSELSVRKEGEQEEKAEATARFVFEGVVEDPPPVRLRPHAHEAARQAVEENEGYEPQAGLTTVFYAKRAPAQSLLGRVLGALHL